ncbi:MAG: hypothetical protein H0X19_05890 [Rubrobacter sp.]|jgi:hypothetical protein|nr:hypothetical protein [Rubrobacteraceae bacterium]MBA3793650.1 hypothetical protein [Rubrobacter sp.]MDQ3429014.1 hypothetical protein [Actinomycetota bacterium]
MDEDSYYIVTEGGAPAIEEVSAIGGKVAIVCERPDLAEDDETFEPITFDDLALLLEARADIGYVRVRGPEGPRTVEKPEFLGDTYS